MKTTIERADEWSRWLRSNGHDLGMVTGQDSRVLKAVDACWHAYAVADKLGRERLWSAVVSLFGAMQPKCWKLGIELVARAMDWDDRPRMRRQMMMYQRPDDACFLEAPEAVPEPVPSHETEPTKVEPFVPDSKLPRPSRRA